MELVGQVREEVFNHFERKFLVLEGNRPLLEGIPFKDIHREETADLEKLFLEIDIKKAVWECGGSKSPEPDGYSFFEEMLAHY